jgi:hypothetical protein
VQADQNLNNRQFAGKIKANPWKQGDAKPWTFGR